jgi:hypothetical protein
MRLEDRILSVGRDLERLAGRLHTLGYQFYEPADVFPGPAPDTESIIVRIEREIGPLPEAIKLFWRRVGSVNFIGEHPDWDGCEYPDPLVVFPPMYALAELEDFLAQPEIRLQHNFPYLVPVAPDPLHKQGVSGGMSYNLGVPAVADDPPLNDERHRLTFIAYLELAVQWGGFPGLDQCPGHDYPLGLIRGGLREDR